MSPILHLFGNWKWTGPAESALVTARASGDGGLLMLGRCPFRDLEHAVLSRALRLGLRPVTLNQLQKHWNPLRTGRAAAEVVQRLGGMTPGVIHVHLDSDHAAARAAVSLLPRAAALVRSVHEAGPHAARTRRLLRRSTDLWITPTRLLAESLESDLGLPPREVAVVEPPVDLQRFRFTEERRRRGRQRLNLTEHELVVGIVARIQPHRRFELLWETWERWTRIGRPICLLVLGRGTHQSELAKIPVADKKLSEWIRFAGYQEEEDYLEALAACDFGIFLVPGTEIGCRAVREWMAMGRGVLATRRPPLPELVEDPLDGRLVDEEPESMLRALTEHDAARMWKERGKRALLKAQGRFSANRAEIRLRALYSCASLMVQGTTAEGSAEPPEPALAISAVRPGFLEEALAWSQSSGIDPGRVQLLHPDRSRDIVSELLTLLHRSNARRLLMQPHPEWDRSLLRELQELGVETTLLDAPSNLPENHRRWLQGMVQRRWPEQRVFFSHGASPPES